MVRYLVGIEPDRSGEVKAGLRRVGITPVAQTFDYVNVDIARVEPARMREKPLHSGQTSPIAQLGKSYREINK